MGGLGLFVWLAVDDPRGVGAPVVDAFDQLAVLRSSHASTPET